ncbi:MAG: hypothetical protein WDW36_000297 [Sanguina aurantia]
MQAGRSSAAGNCGLPLSKVVAAAGTNLLDFFRELPVVIEKLEPHLAVRECSPALLAAATQWNEWQSTVLRSGLLARKYRDNFNRFLHQLASHKQVALRLGWLLFLVLKVKLLSRFPDLVSCVELLVCSVNVLVANAPTLSNSVAAAVVDGKHVDTLCVVSGTGEPGKRASDHVKTDLSRVQQRMASADALLAPLFAQAVEQWKASAAIRQPQPPPPQQQQQQQQQSGGGISQVAPGRLTSCSRVELLVSDPDLMNAVVAVLDREYEAHYSQSGEIDEREFLTLDFSKFASPRLNPGTATLLTPARQPAPAPAAPLHPANPHPASAAAAAAAGIPAGSSPTPNGSSGHSRSLLGPGSHCTNPPSPSTSVHTAHTTHAAGPHADPPHSAGGGAWTGAVNGGGGGRGVLHGGLQRSSKSGGAWGARGALGGFSPLPSMGLTPGGGQAMTPISSSLASVTWLQQLAGKATEEPTANLQRYFTLTGHPGLAAVVHGRAQLLSAAAIPDDAPSVMPFPPAQPSLAASRRIEAVKLYYVVLESILASEERSTGSAHFPTLLASAKFHTAMLACSCEVVTATHKQIGRAFPAVLEAVRLQGFDLLKTVSTFVRHAPHMPSEIKRHLFTCEEKVLESLGWESGSSLYTLIVAQDALNTLDAPSAASPDERPPSQVTPAADVSSALPPKPPSPPALETSQSLPSLQLQLEPPSDPNTEDPLQQQRQQQQRQQASASRRPSILISDPMEHDSDSSSGRGPGSAVVSSTTVPPPSPRRRPASSGSDEEPAHKRARGNNSAPLPATVPAQLLPRLPACVGAAPQPGEKSDPAVTGLLHEFIRKVLKLMSHRLAALCSAFDFAPWEHGDVTTRVYEAIEFALYHRTQLFYGRHIDQIMLSALYGFCKVYGVPKVLFKDIVAQYRTQAQSSQALVRSVALEVSNPALQAISRGDIISFYNQAFVPAMKGFLMDQHAATPPPPPVAAPAAVEPSAQGHHHHHQESPLPHAHALPSHPPPPDARSLRHHNGLPPLGPSSLRNSPRPQAHHSLRPHPAPNTSYKAPQSHAQHQQHINNPNNNNSSSANTSNAHHGSSAPAPLRSPLASPLTSPSKRTHGGGFLRGSSPGSTPADPSNSAAAERVAHGGRGQSPRGDPPERTPSQGSGPGPKTRASPRPGPADRMPSGLATLLRALDTTQGQPPPCSYPTITTTTTAPPTPTAQAPTPAPPPAPDKAAPPTPSAAAAGSAAEAAAVATALSASVAVAAGAGTAADAAAPPFSIGPDELRQQQHQLLQQQQTLLMLQQMQQQLHPTLPSQLAHIPAPPQRQQQRQQAVVSLPALQQQVASQPSQPDTTLVPDILLPMLTTRMAAEMLQDQQQQVVETKEPSAEVQALFETFKQPTG